MQGQHLPPAHGTVLGVPSERCAAFRPESYSSAPLLAQEVFASWRVPCKGAVACPPSGFGHCHAISASSLQGLSEA